MFSQDLTYFELAHNFSAVFHWGLLLIIGIAFFYYLHKEEYASINRKMTITQVILSFLLIVPIVLLFAYYPIEWGTYADKIDASAILSVPLEKDIYIFSII